MRRSIATATIIAGVVAVGFSSSAAAADLELEYGQTTRQSNAGTGTTSGSGSADAGTGAMTARSSATGGDLLGLPLRLPSNSVTSSYVGSEVIGVREGSYRVTVTLAGADTDERAVGNGRATSQARILTAYDEFRDPHQSHALPLVNHVEELPHQPNHLEMEIDLYIPAEGTLSVLGDITATSNANGRGHSASVSARVDATSIDVTRLGSGRR